MLSKLICFDFYLKMIKIYTMDTCPWCDKAKDFLKSKNLEFVELNVQDDMKARDEMIKNTKQMKVPVLDINGTMVIGFNEDEILKAIDN